MPKQSTGILRYGNALERKGWMVEGMLQKASESFWRGLTGNNANAVVYQKNDFGVKAGHNIIFDYSGMLATAGFRGKEQAFGNAPAKMKFSDSLTLEFGRYTVDNGMEFDAEALGDLDLASHADSREKLADNFVRAKDQMLLYCLNIANTVIYIIVAKIILLKFPIKYVIISLKVIYSK